MTLVTCGTQDPFKKQAEHTDSDEHAATIMGRIVYTTTNKGASIFAMKAHCPGITVSLNGSPAPIVFEEDCSFIVPHVAPSENIFMRMENSEQGTTGAIILQDVAEGQLVEILVELNTNALNIYLVDSVCTTDEECDDGVGCTVDTCDVVNGTCVHTPDDAACPDDHLFCNGQEICDPIDGCISTGNPCPEHTACNEETDTCESEAGKVTICHKGKRTISVGAPAVPAHLAHGDTLGPCP